jgi:hypothetical protein
VLHPEGPGEVLACFVFARLALPFAFFDAVEALRERPDFGPEGC